MGTGQSNVDADSSRTPNRWGEGERLRQEILDAAERLLDTIDRPEDLSLRAIAREAGVSAPAIYLHFAGKAELMWCLLDSVYASLARTIRTAHAAAPPTDPWSGLRAAVDAYCQFATVARHRYDLVFRIAPVIPSERQPGNSPLQQVLDAWCDVIRPCLKAQDHPRVRVGEAGKLLWSGLHGQIGLWWNISDDPGHREFERLRESLLRVIFEPLERPTD
ncbi:TetR/AcrR family transcriptional regulator [Rhodococcus wratislaviensis]|uniref:TetR/AcrR family transcriptional regulator n=1 Tax=Rhodococcus wratislaviensis TaxID=44752 RepID=UPI003663DFA1